MATQRRLRICINPQLGQEPLNMRAGHVLFPLYRLQLYVVSSPELSFCLWIFEGFMADLLVDCQNYLRS